MTCKLGAKYLEVSERLRGLEKELQVVKDLSLLLSLRASPIYPVSSATVTNLAVAVFGSISKEAHNHFECQNFSCFKHTQPPHVFVGSSDHSQCMHYDASTLPLFQDSEKASPNKLPNPNPVS